MVLKKRYKRVTVDYLSAVKRDISYIEGVRVKTNITLRGLTTFKIGGNCRLFLEPITYKALKAVKNYLDINSINYYILGAGSNILAPDEDIECVLSLRGLVSFSLNKEPSFKDGIILRVGAGFSLKRLISWCMKNSFSGLESLIGIPASVGGAIYMNAGIKEESISDSIAKILVLKDKELIWLKRDDISPSYRDLGLRAGEIICASELKLKRCSQKLIKDKLLKMINSRVKSQPIGAKSAGCIFKNPKGDYAGRLIELCGLKGLRVGDAKVSEKHANFIINLGDARQSDVLELIDIIKAKVRERFSKELSLEVKVWGRENR